MSIIHALKSFATSLIPLGMWLELRQRPLIRRYAQVGAYWRSQIDLYRQGKLTDYTLSLKQNIGTDKIIWQYWGQGVDEAALPEIVRLCFASVDKHRGAYRVIRLSDETIQDYLDLPDFVAERQKSGNGYTRTLFSDLLRTALLATYGGVWLDATILLTRPFDAVYTEPDFFMFQRSDEESHKLYWRASYYAYWGWAPEFRVRCLNSVIFAKQGSKMLQGLHTLLMHYWQTQDEVMDYFIYQILFYELVESGVTGPNCPIVNDALPHIIHTRANAGAYPGMSNAEVIKHCGIHKMTYFTPEAFARLQDMLRAEGAMP